MKYIVLKSNNRNGKYKYVMVGTIEASSLGVASDLVFKKFRKEVKKENGGTYLIVPHSKNFSINDNKFPLLSGMPYSVVQYREPREGLL